MPNRVLARLVMTAAVTCSVAGFVLLVAFPLGAYLPFHWPLGQTLAWDTALSLLFFFQHSVMVRRPVRAALHVPEAYQAAVYAIASGFVLILVALLWQPSNLVLFTLEGPVRIATRACTAIGLAVLIWGAMALRTFDPCGVNALRSHLRGSRPTSMPFVVRGPYRWVRHPLYSAILLLFWAIPDVSADRLLFNILWTAWMLIGTRLEEADLVSDFGDAYRQYQRQVPMLIPWRVPQARASHAG